MKLSTAQLMDRLTLGPAPGLADTIEHPGADRWLEAQLSPQADPVAVSDRLDGLDAISLDPVQLFQRYWIPFKKRKDSAERKQYRKQLRELYFQTAGARLWRGYESPWQLRELLVDFWFNHFNVFFRKGLCALWTGNYEQEAIRPHVLGKFSDMLLATARHPAMLFYLDNWMNVTPNSPWIHGRLKGYNENYAREVMELHTIGLHYHQADVYGATHLLTGWGLDRHSESGFRFRPRLHDSAAQTILGRRFEGGEDAIEDFFRFLATRPDTAQHVSRELAQYFVADRPPEKLVAHMQARFLATEGDLKAVTEAMIEHPAFAAAASRRDKFRTPYRYVLALLRASGVPPDNVQPIVGALRRLGQPLYGCATPNGWANTQAEWLSPDALTTRLDLAVALGGGWMRVVQENETDMPGTMSAMSAAMPGAMADENSNPIHRDQTRHAVDVETLIGALELVLPPSTLAAARSAPKRLRAAVLLGSPQMQYC